MDRLTHICTYIPISQIIIIAHLEMKYNELKRYLAYNTKAHFSISQIQILERRYMISAKFKEYILIREHRKKPKDLKV